MGQYETALSSTAPNGETCGAKLVDTDNLTRLDDDCRTCQEKTVKERRLQREKDNIKRWSLEGNRFQASIERAQREVRQLEQTIQDLQNRRTSIIFSRAPGWEDPNRRGNKAVDERPHDLAKW